MNQTELYSALNAMGYDSPDKVVTWDGGEFSVADQAPESESLIEVPDAVVGDGGRFTPGPMAGDLPYQLQELVDGDVDAVVVGCTGIFTLRMAFYRTSQDEFYVEVVEE